MAFIDAMRDEGHAVESTCRVLREQGCPVAARTYRAWKRGPGQLVHHADAGSQYTAIRFTEHLDLEGIAPSIGTVGDAYDCEHPLVAAAMV
jgi:hypothetical protein